MSLDNHFVRQEPFDWQQTANVGGPARVWSEAGHMTGDGYHPPSLNLEFADHRRYEFVDKPSYDTFRENWPQFHRTVDDFGDRDRNKLSLGGW